MFKNQNSFDSLVTSYLENNDLRLFNEKEQFFKFLQFLSFIRKFEGLKKFIDNQVYYIIEFSLAKFLRFTSVNEKNQYQRIKALNFLKNLQEIKPLLRKFFDNEFRSSVMFSYLKLEKEQ